MPPEATTFGAPRSRASIVMISDGARRRGSIFDPSSLREPTPWNGSCPRCRGRKPNGWPLSVRKAVALLCSGVPDRTDGTMYDVGAGISISVRNDPRGFAAVATGASGVLRIIKLEGKPALFDGDRRLKTPSVTKAIDLLCSARPSTREEMETCDILGGPTDGCGTHASHRR